ncbi:UNVERIFIED_CONTAM: putative LRR receptor-like serine/threonine-protein kinase [Sesamum radiatum]|uniref:non-specific serine/threonine protein kinase n=1 Tax=Sesamum radiatum TaxID=300843 RepID=A0AAW2T2R2_SESRA
MGPLLLVSSAITFKPTNAMNTTGVVDQWIVLICPTQTLSFYLNFKKRLQTLITCFREDHNIQTALVPSTTKPPDLKRHLGLCSAQFATGMMDGSNLLLFILWSMHLFISCLALNSLNITTDQSALLDFKSQLEHEPGNVLRSNWSSDTPVCSWTGITCSSRHLRVAAINISNMDLSGLIPPQLGNLSFLVSLDLSGNKFQGDLPEELANLKRLRFISFSFNRFSGKIPSWFGALPNLQELLLENCSFTGSIPPSLTNISKLETLDLMSNSLDGMIPVEIGNLHNLKVLKLRENQLSGSIPASIFNISTLEKVDFTTNDLSGNLPANMCRHVSRLKYFSVFSNQLYGQIPSTIDQCSQLQTLMLQFNQFTGPVPKQIGNLSMLVDLYLGDNNFKGEIPAEIGDLPNLEYLTLDAIGLKGPISSFIYNISTLQWLYLGQNNLTGNLPTEICLHLPAIQGLYLGQNQLGGSIPRELVNCSSLVDLYMDETMLTGEIPSEIGNLLNLEILVLGSNHLTEQPHWSYTRFHFKCFKSYPFKLGRQQVNWSYSQLPWGVEFLDFLNLGENDFTSESSEMSFLTSLTNCRRLRVLWIQNNSYSGHLPGSMGNFSSSLEQIDASNSGIKGSIPKEIGNISNLQSLYMDNNGFTGFIPTTIKGLKNLQVLSLIGNKLSGPIPDDFCDLLSLGELTLSKNKLYGPLPACLGNVTSLRYLNLDYNELNSTISPTIGRLKDLLKLNLFSNFLSGVIPPEIGNLVVVTSIDLSFNELSGGIPSTIGGLNNLINLSLAHNRFQGPIPDSVSKILSLEIFDLSYNNLTGVIPKTMGALQHLEYLNLSFNKLTGEIPSGGPFAHFNYQSFISNDALCGPPRFMVPACHSDHHHHHKFRQRVVLLVVLILLAILSVIFALTVWFFLIKRRRKTKLPSQLGLFPDVTFDRISYHDLERATNGFSETNLLGIGSFGSVYKGVFVDGTAVAIKVFNLEIEGCFKSFDTECEVLRNLRHRNLTKVISSCSNIDFRALILEYMPNGSLEKWLHSHNELLNLSQRLSIMIDVASAIDYLHHGYTTPVVHCDLKPSNVLLDDSMVAHVSDFGIAKLVNAEDSVLQTNTLATFGYIAPEYGSEGLVSTRCDVYSFGIILMETFTGKRPTDDLFMGGFSLRDWINEAYPHSVSHLIDATLLDPEEKSFDIDCISRIMKLALDCSAELPTERTNMKDALATLHKIRNQFLSSRMTSSSS